MLRRYATYDQIELLRYRFFQNLVTEIQSPLDLLQEYQCDLQDQYDYISPQWGYPMQLQEFVALLQNAEARYIVQDLASSPDILLIWNSYAPYDSITLTNYVLTEPDPQTGFAFILQESESSGLLLLSWSKVETDCVADDTAILSIKNLCKDLNIQ